MKAKSNGWGLIEMLVLVGVLLFFLLVATFFVMRLYSSLDESMINSGSSHSDKNNDDYNEKEDVVIDEGDYRNYELEMLQATRKYYDDYGIDLSNGSVNVYVNELVQAGYIEYMQDLKTGDSCDAYSRVSLDGDRVLIDSYISCDSYKTKGYVG